MKSKYIAFTSPGIAELLEKDMPALKPGEVLVETLVSTVSAGTERANLSGDPNISPARSTVGKPATFPRTLGYSSAGIVKEVGEGVKSVKPGDPVAVSWGKHSQYQIVAEKNVYLLTPLLEKGLTIEDAAMALIATFPMGAIRKTHFEMGESAMVVGLGILGMIAVQLLRAGGAYPVIAVDPVPEKREWALNWGADYAFDPTDPEFEAKVRAVTGVGVKVAVEVTGIDRALDTTLDCMARYGRVALLGCTRHSEFAIDYYRKVHGPGITLVGAHTMARPDNDSSSGWWTTRDDLYAALNLVVGGRIRLGGMVTETHDPADAPEVYARLMTEKTFPVVQFRWK
ncbi:MAG: zinc-binding alcohol dehydrogenase [Clostridia bacterium]|nr:zinc-binding alcohol dehydrogenase [Clostridia bacterium]